MLDFYIGKTYKTKENYQGKVIDFKWLEDGLYFRLENYHTYKYESLELINWGIVFADTIEQYSDGRLYASQEECLKNYSEFTIEKQSDGYLYGKYLDKPSYIRTLPIFDKFNRQYYFSVGQTIYNSLGKLSLDLIDQHKKVRLLNNQLEVYFQKDYYKVYPRKNFSKVFVIERDYWGNTSNIKNYLNIESFLKDHYNIQVLQTTNQYIELKLENGMGYIYE